MSYNEMIEKEAAGLAGVLDAAKGVGKAIAESGVGQKVIRGARNYGRAMAGTDVKAMGEELAKTPLSQLAAGSPKANMIETGMNQAIKRQTAARVGTGVTAGVGAGAIGLGAANANKKKIQPGMTTDASEKEVTMEKVACDRINSYIEEAIAMKQAAEEVYAQAEAIEKAAMEIAKEIGLS